MTKDEWDRLLEAAIRESKRDVKVVSSGCSDRSNRCFATIDDPTTGRQTEIGTDQQEDVAKMQAAVVRQLLAEESS
jgi:hypothetical protein